MKPAAGDRHSTRSAADILCLRLSKTTMHNQTHTQTQLYFVTQYGPIGMSSPVSTGILKVRGGGAVSAQSGLSALGYPALGAPPAWSRGGRAAPRFPTLCKRCASFRTTNQQPSGVIRVHKGHREVKTPNDKKGDTHRSNGGKVKQEPEREHSDHSADGQESHSGCCPGRQR